MVRTADVVIAVGGEFSTLSEIALALKIGLGTWTLGRAGDRRDPNLRADSPQDAIEMARGS